MAKIEVLKEYLHNYNEQPHTYMTVNGKRQVCAQNRNLEIITIWLLKSWSQKKFPKKRVQ
jgi:hypothetical protein